MFGLIVIPLGVGTLVTALIAAYYWYKSSVISAQEFAAPSEPSYDDDLSVQVILAEMNIGSIRLAMNESCRLNSGQRAGPVFSAVLGAATTFAGMFH